MLSVLWFSLLGYLSGSVLFSQLYAALFHGNDVTVNSMDHNPGTYNAFKNGGMACGLFTLVGDFLKGFLPVFLYLHMVPFAMESAGLAFVMVCPVVGTLCPVFHHFKGGKGITVTFGVLAGLWPVFQPLAMLAMLFVLFSCVLVINPHRYRTLCTFVLFAIGTMALHANMHILAGCFCIGLLVSANLLLKPEELQEFSMKPVWKRQDG